MKYLSVRIPVGKELLEDKNLVKRIDEYCKSTGTRKGMLFLRSVERFLKTFWPGE